MKNIERSHLEIILALDELGTLSKAAQQLHLTQPALTHSIRKLESTLGMKLWMRKGRKVFLTPGGERLLLCAKQVLPRVRKAEEELEQLALGRGGILRIGVECHPCYQWLLGKIQGFLGDFPKVDVEVIRQFQFAAMEALIHQKIDLLITPDPFALSSLQFIPIRPYILKALLWASHPLAKKDFLLPEDLQDQTLITYPVDPLRLDVFTQFLAPAGIHPKVHRTVETHEMMILLSQSAKGISILPDWLIPGRDASLVSKDLGPGGIAKSLHLGFRKDEKNREDIQGFLDLAQRENLN